MAGCALEGGGEAQGAGLAFTFAWDGEEADLTGFAIAGLDGVDET